MPTFVSAATSQDGTKVVLTYDAALSSTTAAATAFTVTSGLQGNDVNPVSAVSISGSTVELTITNNIKNDETVKIQYADPSSSDDANAIQNTSGTDAASLATTAVTNSSTMPGSTPVYVGSTTSTDGTKVILTYNKALSSTTAAASAFTVTTGGSANAVTNVAVSGSTVELTLTTTVKNDDYITVAYADPTGGNDANAIQDEVGNDVNHLASTMVASASNVAGTAPIFASAKTNSGGNKVILTFNEDLNTTTAPTSAFTVTEGGSAKSVTGVNIFGKEVQLTLSSAINAGATVTVAYTDPSVGNDANAIQDFGGNDVATVNTVSVTNNVGGGTYSDLVKIRSGEYRDAAYRNTSNNNTYIVRDGDENNTPILIQEDYGGGAEAAHFWDSWQGGYRKLHAVERTASGGYKLLIKESHTMPQGSQSGTTINWSTVETNSSGIVDWSKSGWSEDVSGFEVDFNEDFNDDGAIGVDTSSLTLKTSDTTGAKLATNSSGSLFINTSGTDYVQVVEEWSGSGISLDRNDTWEGGSSIQQALYVSFNDAGNGSAGANADDDKYTLAVKESMTNSWGGQTHSEENWIIYDVNLDGGFSWNATWGVAIQDYEVLFDQDIDGDGSKGVDLSNLEAITTDTASTNVKLKRGSGSLYLVDGGSTYKVVDEWGSNPKLEDSGSWEGGSFSSTGYAVEKNADNTTYSLAIKFTESFNEGALGTQGGASPQPMTAWEVHQLEVSGSNAVLNWENSSFTTSIAGYENVFQQDMDLDGNVGLDLSKLTDVSTDTTSHRLKYDSAGGVYIWDGSNASTLTAITDPNGGAPQFRTSHTWDQGSFTIEPYAVYKDNNSTAGNASDDWYRVAVKETMTNTIGETSSTDINWALYKVGLTGEIDYSATLFKKSITSYEDEFGHDMNGDGNFSGNVTLYDRNTDTTGATLASDTNTAGGSLYIKDGGSPALSINDSWLEESHSWGDGSNESIAIAVVKNDNGTAGNSSDDYYQVAVKQTNKWTDFQTGQLTTDQSWQIYAINAAGGTAGDVNWEKTIWTQTIQGFETDFGQDLDGDGSTGVNTSNLTTSSGDTTGWLLKKDTQGSLYITDSAGNNLKTIKDNYGGSPKFDYTSSWGSGSHKTEAIAAERNSDNSTFSIAIKHENTFDGQTSTDWEILNTNSSGVFDWSNSFWTQDIKTYESTFQQDLDGDGSIGINSSSLTTVSSDSYGDLLKKGEDGSFFITNEAGSTIAITYEWGGKAQFDSSYQWEGGSFTSQAIAVEDETYTSSDNQNTNGYVIAIKNISTYGSDAPRTEWELKYVDSNGVIDEGKNAYLQSIKANESLFGTNASQADLDGDGAFGLDANALTTISTDTNGDQLKKGDGNSLYIVEGADVFPILDEWGGTPTFDWSDSGGSGDNAWSYTSAAYAVESFTDASDGNKKKFLLAVKGTDVFGGTTSTFWETYKIKETSSGSGKWFIDWGSSSWSQSIGNKESVFNQDLDGDRTIFNINNITTTAISTDSSTTGSTAATLTKDSQGALYITVGGSNTAIVDAGGAPVAFDWKDTWAGYTYTSESYAVEGVDSNGNGSVNYYKLAIKQTEENTQASTTSTNWETYQISTAGILDWSTGTYGDVKVHEKDLNQDLDGDGSIWSTARLTFTDVASDTKGALGYLDTEKNLYIAAGKGQTKNAVKDYTGGLISFEDSFSEGSYSYSKSVLAVESADIGGTDYYKILIKNTTTLDGATSTAYETVNVLASTMIVDWGTFSYYDDPKKLEQAFVLDIDGDGTVTTISSSSTTAISTDTTGAKLRQTSDGSLFIKDGDSTIQITSPDGGYVDLNYTETWGADSFKSEAIAVQKVGSDYKLVVEETSTFGSNTDTFYQVYKLTSAGLLDWGEVTYRTKAELNEQEFGQDIDGDGTISAGSASAASDTYADSVTTANTDAEVLQKFQNTAQSDIYSIDNSDSTSSDTKIEMFVKGVDGSGKSEYQMDVKIVQEASDALLKKVGKDTGIGSDAITALTGLMDFNVTIPDAKNHGKIVSLSWVLPDDTVDPKYLKKDAATGEYFDFKFDSKTGEGAKWDNDTKTLTVYVRDNGKYDSDSTAGKVRDPGFISSTSSGNASTAAAGGTSISGPGGNTTTNTSVSINENSKIVHSFTANEAVSWSLRSGADISQFTIDALTGVLSFKTVPDFENPTDSDKNNVYEVVIFSTDADNDSSNQTLSITVKASKNDVKGTTANDSLVGDSYDNEIDGGAGDDTVIFTGSYSNYSFTRNEDSLNISDQRSGTNDGTDTLTNIEYIQFVDQTVQESKVDVVKTYSGNFRDYKFYNKGDGIYEIKGSTGTTDEITGIPKLTFDDKTAGISAITDIKGVFDQITGKENATGEMFRLYNAAFARFPDSDGLSYWINNYSSGVDDARAVASSFIASSEFIERYGDNVSNAKYVETLYTNVLGRDYDQDGYNYWLGNLNNGIETRYELLLGFAESAENKTLFTDMTGFG
ncbi:SwmB domain-containing protein [Prochlorococcus marinus]|uniref:SwmB domain-containing protein n=1 Tax=Prochlorococcus marinus TaxID=1219 RepID=UPI0039B0BE0F